MCFLSFSHQYLHNFIFPKLLTTFLTWIRGWMQKSLESFAATSIVQQLSQSDTLHIELPEVTKVISPVWLKLQAYEHERIVHEEEQKSLEVAAKYEQLFKSFLRKFFHYILSKKNVNRGVYWSWPISLSAQMAVCLSLYETLVILCHKLLNPLLHRCALTKDSFWKHCGKRRNCS